MGSPYVATKNKQVELILKELQPKKGKVFFELGCGDGRVVRRAVKDFEVLGFGFDINPFLCLWAKFLAKKEGLKNIVIERRNILNLSYKNVDYVYLFLLPEIIKKLQKKLEAEMPKKAIVVSHGFAILGWEKRIFKKIDEKPFPTYFYRM